MAFDLLHLNGKDLRQEPLLERRLRLQELVGCNDPSCCIQYSHHTVGNGSELFEAADAMGLEEIVSNRIGAAADMSDRTVDRFEYGQPVAPASVQRMRDALQSAGVQFLDRGNASGALVVAPQDMR